MNTQRLITSDGVVLAYYRWGNPSAVPVVLHHGFAASAVSNWVLPGIVDALTGAGHSVIAMDARGHGQSGKPHDPARYGEARMAQDLREVLAHLHVGRFDLFGYSMGAVASLILASQASGVRRLIVAGVGEGVLECGGVDTRVIHRDSLVAALLTPDISTIADPAAGSFRLFAEANGNDLAALAAQAQRMHATPIPLERITAPVRVLAGMDDMLARQPERLAAAIPGAQLLMVPGDHLGAIRQPALIDATCRFFDLSQEIHA
ncbi:MAG TPA: alpha/beta hydrolase [Rhodanobacter sp.]|nr:alpha/beta hydrolase [Rhodanobacter sp.]